MVKVSHVITRKFDSYLLLFNQTDCQS